MFNLSKEQLTTVLREAYEAGWYGSKDGDEEAITEIIEQLSPKDKLVSLLSEEEKKTLHERKMKAKVEFTRIKPSLYYSTARGVEPVRHQRSYAPVFGVDHNWSSNQARLTAETQRSRAAQSRLDLIAINRSIVTQQDHIADRLNRGLDVAGAELHLQTLIDIKSHMDNE